MANRLRHGQRRRRGDGEGLADGHDGLRRSIERGRAGARRLPRVAARPAVVRRERPDRARRHAARRARRRLRRRLLPRRPRGVQQRQPAAVHAVRHLAAGDLLQREHWSTSTGWRSAGSTSRPTTGGGPSTSSWPRRSSRPVRAASTKGVSIDPTLRGLAPFVVLRRRRDLRRRHRPDLARVLSDESTQDALETTSTLLRDPKLTLTAGAAREQPPARVVRARQGSG